MTFRLRAPFAPLVPTLLCLGLTGALAAGCPPPAEVCDDGQDNDGDGQVDCADTDCAADAHCQNTSGEGEGEGAAGEGEGAAGEGEGAAGEGEGAAGEGEGAAGEGEGEGAAGEGEGEGAAGEGEGEGGEGEGEGEGTADEAGDVNSPFAVTSLPFNTVVNIDPADDADCFAFHIDATTNLRISADDGGDGSLCGAIEGDGGIDPQIDLFDATDVNTVIASNDNIKGGDFCSFLDQGAVAAGDYIACIHSSDGEAVVSDGVHVSIVAVPDEVGGLEGPAQATLPIDRVLDVDPASDFDCFSVALSADSILDLAADDGLGGRCADGTLDTEVFVYDLGITDPTRFDIASDDVDVANGDLCSSLSVALPTGGYVLCLAGSQDNGPAAELGVHFSASATALPADEAGDQSAPLDETLPFTVTSNIAPLGAGDTDCYRFTTDVVGNLAFDTSDGNGNCPGDTKLTLFRGTTQLTSTDGGGIGACAHLAVDEDAGTYSICVSASNGDDSILGVQLTAALTPELIISEIGAPTGNAPGSQYIELFNASTVTATLNATKVQVFPQGSPNANEIIIPDGTTMNAGATYLIVNNTTSFVLQFGLIGSQQASTNEVANGDDPVALVVNNADLDVYGVLGQSGSGQPWNYTGLSASRVAAVVNPTTTFDQTAWTLGSQAADFTPGTR